MKSFKEFGIKAESHSFVGDKIKVDRILNKEIVIHDFKIEDSKFEKKGNGKCLHLQIELNGNKHVVFSGSGVLMQMIEKVPRTDFPFSATIIRENERLEFS